MSIREVYEGNQVQGTAETIRYQLTTTPWGSTPTSVTVTLYQVNTTGRTDVSATCLTGAATVNGDIITTPAVRYLKEGKTYQLHIKFTDSGANILDAYVDITAEA